MRGSLELGALVALVQLQVFASYFLFDNIGQIVAGLERSLAGAGRVFEILDRPPEPERYAGTGGHEVPTTRETAMVEFRDAAFRYQEHSHADEATDPAAAAMVLQGINLSVERGALAALVGPSGGGKSTIVKLLLGFYPLDVATSALDSESEQIVQGTLAVLMQGRTRLKSP